MAHKEFLSACSEQYKNDLKSNIMPFWLDKGLDHVYGGVYTCLDRNGDIMDTTKSVWFQGRFGFIGAYAYNNMEQNENWLAASKSCIDFIEAHCFDPEDGRMYFEVMADGTPLRKRRYVFSECFAAIAMSEYSLASGDKSYASKALRLFNDIRRFIATPGVLPAKYLPTQPAIGHSITMILINTAASIRKAINFRDCRNFPPQDYSQDMKFWWPQCETVIATLYAYIATRDEKYLDMHKKAHEWMYQHFPDTENPEWYGYLHRDGTVAQAAKGNLFKGPFHIPRMLIKAAILCDEITQQQ